VNGDNLIAIHDEDIVTVLAGDTRLERTLQRPAPEGLRGRDPRRKCGKRASCNMSRNRCVM
jgi:hypothetical protein